MSSNILAILVLVIMLGCNSAKNPASKTGNVQVVNAKQSKLEGQLKPVPGIPAYPESKFDYRGGEKKEKLTIVFKEPVIVSVASKPEKWGYFQFPSILQKTDGELAIKWNLTIDAIEAYGTNKFGSAISKDGGKSWQPADVKEEGSLLLPNGDKISVVTPKPVKVEDLKLPPPIGKGMDTYARTASTFYKLHDLPEIRQGVYLNRLKRGETGWKEEKAALYDPQAARYSFRGLFPVLWWGDVHVLNDKSLIAGIYPGFYIGENGKVDPRSGVFFYRSEDNGHSWKVQGRILYVPDLKSDTAGYKRMGFTEPAVEVMTDGSLLAIMRTTDGIGHGPMYACRSTDAGKTWSTPEVMAASGVLPRLLQLENGVTVLASGRPGVQLRFSTDGAGKHWTDPFELLPYRDNTDQVSCGYTGMIATGADRFLVVYSDFNFENEKKEKRKAIKVREVIVTQGK